MVQPLLAGGAGRLSRQAKLARHLAGDRVRRQAGQRQIDSEGAAFEVGISVEASDGGRERQRDIRREDACPPR